MTTNIDTAETGTGQNTGVVTRETAPILLRPDQLVTEDRIYNLRDRSTARYRNSIAELAKQIAEAGQLQPVIVRPDTLGGDGFYVVVAGQRRVDAIKLLAADNPDILVRCEFAISGLDEEGYGVPAGIPPLDVLKQAGQENIGREDFTALEELRLYELARDEYGMSRTDQIAKFFGVSRATVTQTMRLADAPEIVKEALAEGKLTRDGALQVLGFAEDERAAVAEKAKELACAAEPEQEQEPSEPGEAADEPEVEADADADADAEANTPDWVKPRKKAAAASKSDKKAKKTKAAAKSGAGTEPVVTRRHVQQAAKELGVSPARSGSRAGTDPAPKIADVKDYISGWDSDGFKQPVRVLSRMLLEWMRGKGSARKVDACLLRIDALLPGKAAIVDETAEPALAAAEAAASKPAPANSVTAPDSTPAPADPTPAHAEKRKKKAAANKVAAKKTQAKTVAKKPAKKVTAKKATKKPKVTTTVPAAKNKAASKKKARPED